MISGECFTDGWQARKRAELGGCDPVLLEKTIHALALLDALADMAAVRQAHERIFAAENGYRGGNFTPEQGLQGTFATAYRIACVGLAKAPADGHCELLEKGRRELDSHLVGHRFRREEMKTAAAKVALLARALQHDSPPAFENLRYDDSRLESLRNHRFAPAFSAITKLKTAPAAIWYWKQALELSVDSQ